MDARAGLDSGVTTVAPLSAPLVDVPEVDHPADLAAPPNLSYRSPILDHLGARYARRVRNTVAADALGTFQPTLWRMRCRWLP